jgi:tetratricopeptide (TPR) repeat protein
MVQRIEKENSFSVKLPIMIVRSLSDPCRAIHPHKNTASCQRLPVFLKGRSVFVVLVFFLLCAGIGIVTPVNALDNQTLINSLMSKGSQCYSNGDYSCTWAAFESAHQVDPGNSGVLFVHGLYLSRAGNYTGALEKMDAALALDPQNARIWYEKGKVLDKLGRFTESGLYYDRAEELNPSLRVPATERFPLNVLIRNATVIIVAGGFFLLGTYIYFRERRR